MKPNRRRCSSQKPSSGLKSVCPLPAWQRSAAIAPRKAIKSKLSPPRVRAALEGWLFSDELSYKNVQTKLLEKFGISVGLNTLCKFWQRRVQPNPGASTPAIAKPDSSKPGTITITLGIGAQGPVQVRVLGVRGVGK